MCRPRLLALLPLLSSTVPYALGGQISSIQRITYGYPLIDQLPRNHFPRGGTYTAIISGSDLSQVTGFVAANANVTGIVTGKTASSVTVQISSTAVKENDTGNAPIPSVSFSLLVPLGVISSGAVTFDVVTGPPTQITSFTVSNSVEWIPAGAPTTVKYSVTAIWAGNNQFWYIGCGQCIATFGTFKGDQFSVSFSFTTVVTITSPTDTEFSVIVGGVDGAGQGGSTGNAPLSPLRLKIPIYRLDSRPIQPADLANPPLINANPGGGVRIYPEKASPVDPIDRSRVRISVQLSPPKPNIPVYFKSFDVHDPDHTMHLLSVRDGKDNRGVPQEGTLSAISAITNATGMASVVLTVTKNPGDNFRVVASLDSTHLGNLLVSGTDVIQIREGMPVTVGSNGDGTVTAPLLTVWRTVHLEVDSMSPVSGNIVAAKIFRVIPQPPYTALSLDVAPSGSCQACPDPSINRFNGGLLTVVGGGTYRIVSNNRTVVRVFGSLPLSDVGKAVTLVDDDDYNGNDRDFPRGDTGESISPLSDTFSLLESTFGAGYITPVFDGGGTLGGVPFVLNFDSRTGPAIFHVIDQHRNIAGTDDYWAGYLLLAYQGANGFDSDPDYPASNVTGGVTAGFFKDSIPRDCSGVPVGSQGALLFMESLRDRDKGLAIPAPLRDMRVRAAPHELGHQFGLLGDDESCDFNLMSYGTPTAVPGNPTVTFPALCPKQFVPQHLHILRCRVRSPGK